MFSSSFLRFSYADAHPSETLQGEVGTALQQRPTVDFWVRTLLSWRDSRSGWARLWLLDFEVPNVSKDADAIMCLGSGSRAEGETEQLSRFAALLPNIGVNVLLT
jgi:hypothetical protein